MASGVLAGYRLARRIGSAASGAVEAVFVGIALGVMRRDHLHDLDSRAYGDHSSYRDPAYAARGLWSWERSLVEEGFPPGGTVAVVGAGAGRQLIGLSDLGFRPVGYECHPGLREAGRLILRDAGVPADLLPMERDVCPELPESVAGVVAGWGTYSLIQGSSVRIAFLRRLAVYVGPDTPLVLSFLTRPAGMRRYRVAAAVARLFRTLLRRQPVELGDYLRQTWSHEFSEDEVRGELEAAGWTVVRYGEHPYGHVLARAASTP